MFGNLYIRSYESIDYIKVMDLNRNVLKELNALPEGKEWDKELKDIPGNYLRNRGEFLVGIYNREIVTMGGLMKLTDTRAEIKRMRTVSKFQGRGFGQVILTLLTVEARRLGYKELQVDTQVSLKIAQKFYKKNGFVEYKRIEQFGVKSILYQKTI